MTPEIEQKIKERAYEIYEYYRDMGLDCILDKGEVRKRTAQDIWLEAEREILDK